ncbi:MAG: thiamine pyrophosphate-dependent enzyme [Candidatus Latescibacterota bacterium]
MSEIKYERYMTDKIGPLPFCPGCGHELLLKALDKALVKLQPDPEKVVVVTDIGCIGLSDRYFTTSAFHGLHGRSITYGCGLKLARPELTVIVLKGDGGCGIGGTHFLNVSRRNIGITLIIANNFNYGMTGGQHSVTTPTDGKTSTTPWGNPEGPMDLCGTAVAAGAAWVYRATAFDKDLSDVFADAISQDGFAMIDVWELCTAHYMPRNKLRKKELFELLDFYGFSLGLQADKPRQEYNARYYAAYEAGKGVLKKRPPIEPEFDNNVKKQIGIIIAGSAGQKIRSAATIFAEGAMFAGLYATQKDDYPITVQTGHSVAEIIISPEQIDYTGIDFPDYFILISEDGLKRTRARIQKLTEGCVLYADEGLELPETRAKVVRLPFTETGKKVGKLSVSTAAIAAMLEDSGMFPADALEMATRTFQSAKIAEINLMAMTAGAELVSKSSKLS